MIQYQKDKRPKRFVARESSTTIDELEGTINALTPIIDFLGRVKVKVKDIYNIIKS